VVSGVERDDRGVVPWVDEREVVGAHVSESSTVFVDEGSLQDGIGCVGGGEVDSSSIGLRGSGGVIGPFCPESGISDGEEEAFDGVGESDVVSGGWVCGGCESLTGSGLDLLDEDISWCACHTFTFIVGYDGVVAPHVRGSESWGAGDVGTNDRYNSGVVVSSGVFEDEKFGPVTELELDSHVVVWESGSWESDTAVSAVEEWKG